MGEVTIISKMKQALPLLLKEKWQKGLTMTRMLGPRKRMTVDESQITAAVRALERNKRIKLV